MSRFLVTMRLTIDAETEVDANLQAIEIEEYASAVLDEGDTLDVTQIIPLELSAKIEPAEMVAQLRHSRDMLIKTRIVECFDLAREIDKIAWVLEHRQEEGFQLAGYDYGDFVEVSNRILQRTPRA